MKRILLIIAITLCIFQLIVLAVAIDVGPDATDRAAASPPGSTMIMLDNPANETGTITSIEIWAYADLSNVEVATFFLVSGDNYSTRDTVTIGSVTSGSKQTITLDSESAPISLEVETGDYIGMFYDNGTMEHDASGFAGMMRKVGDFIPCTDETFTLLAGDAFSLHGTGATIGWPHKWNTVTIGKWNTKEFTKWNDLE